MKGKTDVDEPERTAVSLFSGIGGLDLGFERAGFRIALQCEIDEFCREVLARHWPGTLKVEDVRKLQGSAVPRADVWFGGFPCQDVSLARMGPRAGLRGRQSGLFFEFARLLEEARPRVIVVENVPGLLSSRGGRDFATVLSTLANLGYGVGWRVLNSRHFGVPQSRQRVYIVGSYQDWRGPASVLFEPERGKGNAAPRRQNGKAALSPFKTVVGDPGGEGPVTPAIAYCLYAESARHTGTDWSRNYVCYPSKGEVRRLTPGEAEQVMGFPTDWTKPEHNGRDVEVVDSLRYHALGNAVTPPAAEWIARRVASYLREADYAPVGVRAPRAAPLAGE